MAGAAARHEQGRPLHPNKPHVRILEPVMTADLDTLLIALYVEPTGSSRFAELHGERDQARQTLERQPADRPAPVITDKGLSGQGTKEFFTGDGLGLALLRPARKDEKQPRPFPNWFRQRVEAVIWTRRGYRGWAACLPARRPKNDPSPSWVPEL